jgi:hypothetical protein
MTNRQKCEHPGCKCQAASGLRPGRACESGEHAEHKPVRVAIGRLPREDPARGCAAPGHRGGFSRGMAVLCWSPDRRHWDRHLRFLGSRKGVMEHYGFTVENVCKQVHHVLDQLKEKTSCV